MVSAYINARNEEKTMGPAIESLISQEHPLREIILINDGSTDDTRKICEYYEASFNCIKLINLPYHEETYVGRWELGRTINHGLREIIKIGIPDFVFGINGDHILPPNYVHELISRMTDKIRISSGTYDGAQLNVDTPIGSGKVIDARLWDKFNDMVYPEKYGYESWVDYRFRKEGYEVSRHDDLVTDCRPVRMNKTKAYFWGKGTYALGGVLPFAILKAFSLRRNGLSFLEGYFSRKDVEKHDDIFDYVGDMQYQKARKQGLKTLNKWRGVKT